MFRVFRDGFWFSLVFVLAFALPVYAQTSQLAADSSGKTPGSLNGTILDNTQAVIAGARIKLTRDGNTPPQETTSGGDGRFSFTNLPEGPFHLEITATGFAAQTSSGNLQPGEIRNLL